MNLDEIHRQFNNTFDANDFTAYRRLLLEHPLFYGDDRASVITSNIKYAADLNSPELIDVLVEFGADVNAQDPGFRPEGAIVHTCLGGSCKVEAARRLLELGAKINHNVDGEIRCKTLDLAISKGNMEMVQLLIQYGAAFNAIHQGMTALDHALSRGRQEIADYLRTLGGKTASELGWIPPPPPELPEIMKQYFESEFVAPPMATIQELLTCDPSIAIHVIDDGYQYILQTEGIASKPIPVDPGEEELRFVEIEMILPCDWPVGDELLKTEENSWPVTWLRRLAMHPHQSETPIGKLFFYPNGSPPQPLARNTEMSVWMLMQSRRDPIYVSDEKQIVIYSAVPLYKEEYEVVQKHGLGELGKRFDANKIHPHQMFVRKNVGLE